MTAKRHAQALGADFTHVVRRVGWQFRLSDADLDDVVQEVRIRLWRAAQKLEEVSPSYVYRASTSAAIDLLRRRRARGAGNTVALDDVEEPVADTADPSRSVEESEIVRRIGEAIDAMSPSRRPAVRMYLAGYSREEVAAARGWSEAKTRNLLYRGLADLRERLTDGTGAHGGRRLDRREVASRAA